MGTSIETDRFAEMPEQELFKLFGTSHKGFSVAEAQRQREKYGKNTFQRRPRFEMVRRTIRQVKDPVVSILLVSSLLLYGIGYTVDGHIILAAFLINIAIALIQEGRVSRAFDLLRKADRISATVVRNGKRYRVPAEDIVPGDIVLLEAGSGVPADVRLIKQNGLQINESIVTGEWAPVDKEVITLTNRRQITEQVNMAWWGTTVVSGTGTGIVVATGNRTVVGGIANNLYEGEAETPLQHQTKNLAKWIMFFVLLSVTAIIIIASVQGVSRIDVVTTAVAVAIAGIPSGLPAAITVVLVVGMWSVLRNGGLVRNLHAAETLGGTTWILTDKTGTLTTGRMTLSEIIFSDAREKVDDTVISSKGRGIIFQTYLTTDGKRLQGDDDESILTGTSIEQAIVHACEEVCDVRVDRESRVAYQPFDSQNRYSSALVEEPSGALRYHTVGAPETLLDRADRILRGGRSVVLTEDVRRHMREMLEEETEKGNRVLAISSADRRSAGQHDESSYDDLLKEDGELTFVALLSLEDPVRQDVPKAIKDIKDAHVTLSVVTGDTAGTALSVARESGIISGTDSEAVTGDDLADMSDEALYAKAQHVRVFARMLPDQKSRLLRVLLQNGETVAMTGDGVNDAPALHRASIGIAVVSGTEVAKEASDLVLLENSFATITKAIFEGKKIIRNLKKILIYLLSTSFSEVVLVGGGLLITAALPISPVQILWANIVEEAFISFAFAFEKESSDIAKWDPRSERTSNIISRNVRYTIILLAVLVGMFLLVTYFFLSFYTGLSQEQIQTAMFLAVSVDSVFLALSLKRLDRSVFRTDFATNKWLLAAIGISSSLLVIAFIVPPISSILSIVPVPSWVFLIALASGLFHVLIVETVKALFFKRTKYS
ncbi:MAG: HAD-IC family P-type ATPase [Candidatus Kaiserbacteria bacterium]|nr:HAD-IC family P-type ATPase [Candidatus Kaiserbacteria bacterium]